MLILCYLIASGAAQGKEDLFLTELMVISISRRVGASIRKVSRRSVIQQRVEGTRSLIGMMVESNINEGNQPIPKNLADLRYGVSLTDSCIRWETTERMFRWGYEKLTKAA